MVHVLWNIDFDEKKCEIDNEIVKTQWLNNIIWIGDKDFRYVNFATYSNGDMIVETTSNPGNSKRMFYAIKKNGRSFFKSKTQNIKTKYYSMEAKDQKNNKGNIRFEAEIFIATVYGSDNSVKEYLVMFLKVIDILNYMILTIIQYFKQLLKIFLRSQWIIQKDA